MRNYFFYILFICVFTNSFGKNEDQKKSSGEEPVMHTRAFYEQEANTDIENLLSSTKHHNFSKEYSKPYDVNERSNRLMEIIDKSLKNSINEKKYKRNLRSNPQINAGKLRRGVYIQNLPLNLRNAIESINQRNSDAQHMNKVAFPNGDTIKRIRGEHNVNTMLRNGVNYVNIKPEVYPLLYTNDDKYGTKEIDSKKGIVRINNQYYTHDNDKLTKLGTKTAIIPMSAIFMLLDFLNKLNARSTNHLKFDNRVEKVMNHLDARDNLGSKHSDYSETNLLRSDENSNSNERLHKLMKYLHTGKILRTPRNALSHDQRPARRGDHRSRHRRSSNTQAGYTQDPDTCKTYNENLEKLWSNLSKLIDIKDQPNDRALHNIAIMIQAYLEHQNKIQPPETQKADHEGPKHKISEIILRIRKLLDKAEVSAEEITKIILKYLRPDYKDVESEDCQQFNEEYLTLSVDLLYKIYLEKTDCQDEDDGMTRRKPGKTNIGHMALSMANRNVKPHIHKGKTQRSRPADKSGNQNERDNLNTRSKSSSKSTSKKHKKSYNRSGVEKSICEKYATRKLIVSLRPVMERFNALLECQLDNTLRSGSSEYPDHRYAFKSYSNENSRRDSKVLPRFPVRNAGRKRNKSHKKIYTERHGSSFENDQDVRAGDHNDETKSANTPLVEAGDTRARVSDNTNNNDYGNEYFKSSPFYDDYDRVYETHQNAFPSLINPSIYLNDKKNTPSMSRSKQVDVTPGIAENKNHNEYADALTFYRDNITTEPNDDFFKRGIETGTKNTPFIDLTKLRSDNQLIAEKNKIHVKTFESITEFLKTARGDSMKTPEFAVPFALDTNKGYVELTHLIKYPKTLLYRPQFLVINSMPYDDFLKTINNSNMTNDDVRLMKIVRHLPNGSVQVLFETEDSEAPLEIRNLNDKDTRRSGSPDLVVDYQSESRIDTANENNNADLTDEKREGFSLNYRNEARMQDFKSAVKSDSSSRDEYLSPDLDSTTDSDTLGANEELSQNSYFGGNSDTNSSPLPILFANHPSPDFSKEMGSSVASQIGGGIQQGLGTQTGSGMQMGLDPALNLGLKLNPVQPSQLNTLLSKLMPSHSNAQTTPNPSLNSQSYLNSNFDSPSKSYSDSNYYSHYLYHLNSHSGSWSTHSQLPNTDSNNQEVGKNFPSPTLFISRWWRKWKSVVKEKMKQIIEKMTNLVKNFDHIVKL